MKLSEIKQLLTTVRTVNFQLPDATFVPGHFHVTEIGRVAKNFIDCGGTVRKETMVNFQLWDANDFEHRLKPQKLLQIIELSENILGIGDFDIEVEYQTNTIGKYDLGFDGENFQLLNKKTACLASDQCGVPSEKTKVKLSEINNVSNSCAPDGGCC